MTEVRRGSSTVAIVRELEEDIVLGFLHPKERLTEDELMERFKVRRHVIRTALTKLVQMGLVEHRKNVGALVRSYEFDEIMDLYDMRELLEGTATTLMDCPAQPDDIAKLESIQDAHDRAVVAQDIRGIFRANMAFHETFFALCPNKVMVDSIRYFAIQTHVIRSSSVRSAEAQALSMQEHRSMINALKAGRRDELARICREHIRPARDEYLAANRLYSSESLASSLAEP
jgi:DNA-binding GntR family transcriptional regulator